MLLNKNDFESGLKQDYQQVQPQFKPPTIGVGGIVPVVGAAGPKDNLFGPPQNLGGFSMIP
jgi:hypothetical protein